MDLDFLHMKKHNLYDPVVILVVLIKYMRHVYITLKSKTINRIKVQFQKFKYFIFVFCVSL